MQDAPPVTILYFAWLRERAGTGEERVSLPAGVRTVGALIEHLAARDAGHAAAFASRESVRCAVNQDFAGPDTAVHPGDEIAFFPPVTGG
ncbi:MAG: molybdopterin converting factor subunit 1 [Acetobacteraceae bacterium]